MSRGTHNYFRLLIETSKQLTEHKIIIRWKF